MGNKPIKSSFPIKTDIFEDIVKDPFGFKNDLWNGYAPYSHLEKKFSKEIKNKTIENHHEFYRFFIKNVMNFKGISGFTFKNGQEMLFLLTIFDQYIFESDFYNVKDYSMAYDLYCRLIKGEVTIEENGELTIHPKEEKKDEKEIDKDLKKEIKEKDVRTIARYYLNQIEKKDGTIQVRSFHGLMENKYYVTNKDQIVDVFYAKLSKYRNCEVSLSFFD